MGLCRSMISGIGISSPALKSPPTVRSSTAVSTYSISFRLPFKRSNRYVTPNPSLKPIDQTAGCSLRLFQGLCFLRVWSVCGRTLASSLYSVQTSSPCKAVLFGCPVIKRHSAVVPATGVQPADAANPPPITPAASPPAAAATARSPIHRPAPHHHRSAPRRG